MKALSFRKNKDIFVKKDYFLTTVCPMTHEVNGHSTEILQGLIHFGRPGQKRKIIFLIMLLLLKKGTEDVSLGANLTLILWEIPQVSKSPDSPPSTCHLQNGCLYVDHCIPLLST